MTLPWPGREQRQRLQPEPVVALELQANKNLKEAQTEPVVAAEAEPVMAAEPKMPY